MDKKPWIIGFDGTEYDTIDDYRRYLSSKRLTDEMSGSDRAGMVFSAIAGFAGLILFVGFLIACGVAVFS